MKEMSEVSKYLARTRKRRGARRPKRRRDVDTVLNNKPKKHVNSVYEWYARVRGEG